MAESVRCPKCFANVPAGRLCERCGAPLAQETAVPATAEPTLEFDAMCLQFAGMRGYLRVRFNPGTSPEGCDNVTLTLRDQTADWQLCICEGAWFNRPREFNVVVSPHAAGPIVFDITLSYEKDGILVKQVGDWATVSVGKGDERVAAENLVVNITTNITGGHASEIHNSTQARDRVEEILRGDEDLTDRLRAIVSGGERAYTRVELFGNGLQSLPPQPAAARTDRLVLDLGLRRLLLFSGRIVTFGRRRDQCDITWRNPNATRKDRNDPANYPYLKISKQQCTFEHRGEAIALIDGMRDEWGVVKPSSYGTYFNARRVEGEVMLTPDNMGEGRISFSDSAVTGRLTACLPGEVCANCTRADRSWCHAGKRPSLVFRRLDGAPETAVMVWSCFLLEEVDPSFEGVKIFRADEGFAWRRGRHCGWLVPGESVKTGCGTMWINSLPSPADVVRQRGQGQ